MKIKLAKFIKLLFNFGICAIPNVLENVILGSLYLMNFISYNKAMTYYKHIKSAFNSLIDKRTSNLQLNEIKIFLAKEMH